MIAAILASGEPERLYTGLSLLVSAASEGEPARGLVTFGALQPMLDPDLAAWALRPGALPHVVEAEREPFARTLAELRDLSLAIDLCEIFACAAALAAAAADRIAAEAYLRGVKSTPCFLRETAGARLVVV
jgi:hypothetical protein